MSRLLHTIAEVGEQVGLSESTIRRLIRRGDLHAVTVGGSVRVPDHALRAFVDSLPSKSQVQER